MGLTPETAARLIARHGRTVTILREGAPVSDGMGGTTPGLEIEYPADSFVASYDDELRGQGGIGLDDAKILLSVEGLTITPKTGDRMRLDDEVLNVIAVSPVAPDGDVRFWILQGRAT